MGICGARVEGRLEYEKKKKSLMWCSRSDTAIMVETYFLQGETASVSTVPPGTHPPTLHHRRFLLPNQFSDVRRLPVLPPGSPSHYSAALLGPTVRLSRPEGREAGEEQD